MHSGSPVNGTASSSGRLLRRVMQPERDQRLFCPVLYHQAGQDRGCPVRMWTGCVLLRPEHKKRVEIRTYPNAPHAFFNEQRVDSYRADATQRLGRQLPRFSRPASKVSKQFFQRIVSASRLRVWAEQHRVARCASHLYSTSPIKNPSRPCDGGRLCIRGLAQCQVQTNPSELHTRFPINLRGHF